MSKSPPAQKAEPFAFALVDNLLYQEAHQSNPPAEPSFFIQPLLKKQGGTCAIVIGFEGVCKALLTKDEAISLALCLFRLAIKEKGGAPC